MWIISVGYLGRNDLKWSWANPLMTKRANAPWWLGGALSRTCFLGLTQAILAPEMSMFYLASLWLSLINFNPIQTASVQASDEQGSELPERGRQMRRREPLLPSSSWHLVGETHAPSVGKEVTEGQTKCGASEICLWWVEREVKRASWRRHLMVQSHDQDKDKIMAWENLLSKYLPLPLNPLQQASACLVNLDSLFLVKGTLLSSWACGSLKYETIFSSFHGS